MIPFSCVLIVSNEEKRIEKFLREHAWIGEIIVVDGGSRDRTIEIATQHRAKVYTRAFDNFSSQKNFGIDQAKHEWVLSLDADETVSPELQTALCRVVASDTKHDGFFVRRENRIFGKILKHAGQGVDRPLRFFRKEKGRFEQPIHERVVLHGSVGELGGSLFHDSLPTLYDYIRKLELYTDLEVQWLLKNKKRPHWYDFVLIPYCRFIYYYIFRLGFLDGYPGLLFHALSSFYYFFKHAKLKEVCDQRSHETGP